MTQFSISDRIERALLEFAPGAKLVRTWSLDGGISATMTAFEIERPDGQRQKLIARQPGEYRFRHNPDAAQAEADVLTLLARAGLPVQTTYFVEARTEETTKPFFVIEFVEGGPELNPPDKEAFIERYARQLAAIHQVDLSQTDLTSLPSQGIEYSPRREILNDSLREGDIRSALESITPITRSNPPVLRHGDFWPGNILWRDGEIVAVIDWEEVLIGEPLADVAICRLDLWWVLGEAGAQEFTDRWHALTQADLTDLPYWDLCASLRPITNIHEWAPSFAPLGRPDITEATMTRDHQLFVEQALAKFRSEGGGRRAEDH